MIFLLYRWLSEPAFARDLFHKLLCLFSLHFHLLPTPLIFFFLLSLLGLVLHLYLVLSVLSSLNFIRCSEPTFDCFVYIYFCLYTLHSLSYSPTTEPQGYCPGHRGHPSLRGALYLRTVRAPSRGSQEEPRKAKCAENEKEEEESERRLLNKFSFFTSTLVYMDNAFIIPTSYHNIILLSIHTTN